MMMKMNMTRAKKMMKMTKIKRLILPAMLIAFACPIYAYGGVKFSNLTNKDWLDLVRQYTSADGVSYEGSKWDNLVGSYSGKKPVNALAEWWSNFGDETLTQ